MLVDQTETKSFLACPTCHSRDRYKQAETHILKHAFFLIFIFISSISQGQIEYQTYISEGRTFERNKKYSVNEIIVYSDSSYVQNVYKIADKKQRDYYRNFVPQISTGKFRKEGDFYIFRNLGLDYDYPGHFKMDKAKLTYYYLWKEKRFKKGAVFRRIEEPRLPINELFREISDYIYLRNMDKELTSQTKTMELNYGDYIKGKLSFKVTEYIYPESRELIRLKISNGDYPEYTDNYYYKNGNLIYAESWIKNEKYAGEFIKIFIDNGKAINILDSDKETVKEIIKSGINYMMDYKASL